MKSKPRKLARRVLYQAFGSDCNAVVDIYTADAVREMPLAEWKPFFAEMLAEGWVESYGPNDDFVKLTRKGEDFMCSG